MNTSIYSKILIYIKNLLFPKYIVYIFYRSKPKYYTKIDGEWYYNWTTNKNKALKMSLVEAMELKMELSRANIYSFKEIIIERVMD